MGFRFRKSVKLSKGMRLRAGKRGMSLSLGGKGGRLTLGNSGTWGTIGIPGTGVYYTSKIGSKGGSKRRASGRSGTSASEIRQAQKAVLSFAEDGKIIAIDENGRKLPEKICKEIVEENPKIQDVLKSEISQLNEDVDRILKIHLDTPAASQLLAYDAKNFETPMPDPPEVKKPGMLGKFFQSKQEDVERENREAAKKYVREKRFWEEKKKEHEDSEKKRKILIELGRYSDVEKMQELLEIEFSQIEWPRETMVSFQIDDNGKAVLLDVDLPEIEDLPNEYAELAKNGLKINTRKRTETQIRKDYMNHVHGIAFRLVGVTFFSLPLAERVLVSGYSQRVNRATGHVEDEYLFSVRVDREKWKSVNFQNLENIDLPECLGAFEPSHKLSRSRFAAKNPIPAALPKAPDLARPPLSGASVAQI